ncbi:hypothetical protein B0H14DRAFT_3556321 [Mycena olivaceomarginata]|nr:hypothetical protein B0H14DRAFT_3556321 [Mycena olivaceomarginata]
MGYPGSPTSDSPSSLSRHRSALLLLPPSSTRPTPPLSSSDYGSSARCSSGSCLRSRSSSGGTSSGCSNHRWCTTGIHSSWARTSWACYLAGRAVDRLDKRRGGDKACADLRLLVVKRGLLWSAKIAYMVLFLRIIIPTLIALPIRLSLDPILVPRIRIVDEWAIGLLYAKIMLHVNRAQPTNPITRGVQHITNNGWMHPEPVTATREVIGRDDPPCLPPHTSWKSTQLSYVSVPPSPTAWAVVHLPPLPPPLARPPPPPRASYDPRLAAYIYTHEYEYNIYEFDKTTITERMNTPTSPTPHSRLPAPRQVMHESA